MKLKSRKSSSFILLFLSVISIPSIIIGSAFAVPKEVIGVSPQNADYYRRWSSEGTLKCKEGSNHFTKSQLNDDFCDCLDGSDEPGTSACPNGKFYCKNTGHVALTIYSSRVNDGICDCCDGSDEYDGKIECSNTCWEAGKVARDNLKKKITTYQEGLNIRKKEVEQAKLAIEKEEAELSKVQKEEKSLKVLVEQLKGIKEKIEKAEEKERLQKEKEDKERKEAEETKAEDKSEALKDDDINDTLGLVDDPSPQEDHKDSLVEDEHKNKDSQEDVLEQVKEEDGVENVKEDSLQENGPTENTESLSKAELGRLVASRWIGEKTAESTKESDADQENHQDSLPESHDEEYDAYDSDDDRHKYDNVDDNEESTDDFDSSSSYKSESDDESDLSGIKSQPSWLEKIQNVVRRVFEAVNFFQGPVDISEASRVRKEYDDYSAKLSNIQSRMSRLEEKLKQDFGPEKEFYSFYDQCFEMKQNKYVYKICPYKDASQKEGYSSTTLGSWEKFEDSYRTMQFLNGDKCWNGPDRSMKVKLRCGLKNEVTSVDEPSRCEYLSLFSTPVVCTEEKLKELEEKLYLMNKQPPESHDEL